MLNFYPQSLNTIPQYPVKMASPVEMSPASAPDAKKRKKRNKNFTVDEENVIQAMYDANSEVLNQKFSSDVTNKAKSAVWQKITDAVNMKGVSARTVDQVKEKWGNMTQKAKKSFTDFKLQQKKTGGGPPPPELSQATANIIDIMKDTASFSGVPGGLDTDIASCDLLSIDVVDTFGAIDVPEIETQAQASTDTEPSPGTASGLAQLPTGTTQLPVDNSIPSNKCISRNIVKKSSKCTQDDVLHMQYQVLAGQLDQQNLEKNKINLESQSLKLQIELLQRLLSQNDLEININPTQLLMSMLN